MVIFIPGVWTDNPAECNFKLPGCNNNVVLFIAAAVIYVFAVVNNAACAVISVIAVTAVNAGAFANCAATVVNEDATAILNVVCNTSAVADAKMLRLHL